MSRQSDGSWWAFGAVGAALTAGALLRRRGGRNVPVYELDFEVEIPMGVRIETLLPRVSVTLPWDGREETLPSDADVIAAAVADKLAAERDDLWETLGPPTPEDALWRLGVEALVEVGTPAWELVEDTIALEDVTVEAQFSLQKRPLLGGRTVILIDGKPVTPINGQ